MHELTTRDLKTGCVHVVIDTPKGSRHKFKFDEAAGFLKLSHTLPVGMSFPFDFGSVPRTRAEDGDALDVLVLLEAPTFPGCLVGVRLIGVLRARQRSSGRTVRNDRLIAVPITPVNDSPERHLGDLGKLRVDEILSFFVTYNRAHGRDFVPEGRGGPAAAEKVLKSAMHAYARPK